MPTGKVALFGEVRGQRIKCGLCPHGCVLRPGQCGICRVRSNRDGVLTTTNYDKCSSLSLDPVEKKPLYHFFPGKNLLSIGSLGCNLRCEFCQNWTIAHGEDPEFVSLTPGLLVETASKQGAECIGVAYTYSEPLVWYEFVFEAAQGVRGAGLKNVLVTNGYVNLEPLERLLKLIDGINLDIKGFSPDFYRRWTHGSLDSVLRSAKTIAAAGVHLEVTTLVIPGLNDDLDEIGNLARWIKENLGSAVPYHLSRYFPAFKMELPPTPLETMLKVWEEAQRWLDYVYLGNVAGLEGRDTLCPSCGLRVIERKSRVKTSGLNNRNECCRCGRGIPLVTGFPPSPDGM